ncbi:toxin biosynthesis ketoreductase [Acaromyces ingoldii]|uniref:Toxin biosynthesis ketoreductase n=1 Tax=Acaromyces ingoldii TaxID=215250 RepID=A0A316YNV1_9BASI|nr:toxin biosynthesis ketoreductase [Acaromyces ingoldii]PWN91057.1 toxin biosynthesis ketoreductase [Acaromyces ingoldii]
MVNYLITGATRGIGAELVKQLAADPKNTVVAGVRDPAAEAAKTLAQLRGHVITVQIDSSSDSDAKAAAKAVLSRGIDCIDVIIANAGVASDFKPVADVSADDFRQTLTVNAVGPLLLFQAFLPLLKKSASPKFLVVSSAIASLGIQRQLPYKSTSYGASKAAVNFLALRIAIEYPDVVSLALHPGLVATDLAAFAQSSLGSKIEDALSEGAAITVEQSAAGIIKLANEAAVDTHSGKFFKAQDGSELPW